MRIIALLFLLAGILIFVFFGLPEMQLQAWPLVAAITCLIIGFLCLLVSLVKDQIDRLREAGDTPGARKTANSRRRAKRESPDDD